MLLVFKNAFLPNALQVNCRRLRSKLVVTYNKRILFVIGNLPI